MKSIFPLTIVLVFLTACSSPKHDNTNDYNNNDVPYTNTSLDDSNKNKNEVDKKEDPTDKTALSTSDETTFNDQADVLLNTLMKSNTITITSIDTNESLVVSLTHGELYINDAFISAKKSIVKRDDKIRIEMLSANEYHTLLTATLTIGETITREFKVQTKMLPLAYTTLYGSDQDDEVNSAYFKGDGVFALSGITKGDMFAPNKGNQELISLNITALNTLSFTLDNIQKSNTFRYDNILNAHSASGNILAGNIGIRAFVKDPLSLKLEVASINFVRINALVVDKDNNIYIAGDTEDALLGQNHLGMKDAFLAKYNLALELQWVKQFGTAQDDSVKKILLKYKGNTLEKILTVGETDGSYSNTISKGGHDIFVQSHFTNISIQGALSTAYTVGTTLNDQLKDAVLDSNNNTILIRYTDYISYVESHTTFGTTNYVQKISPELYGSEYNTLYLTDNAIYAAGRSFFSGYRQINSGSSDIVISKIDVNGNHLFTRIVGTPEMDEAIYIHATEEGVVSIVGNTEGTFSTTVNKGGTDIFYMKLSE